MQGGGVAASIIEEQRRIHALESQREQEQQQVHREEPRHEEPRREEPRHEEPRREEPRHEEPRVEVKAEEPRYEPPPPRAPRIEVPQIEPGLVMIETDRAKAPSQPVEEKPQHLGRPRRERAKPLTQEEELQQVETRK